MALSLLIVSCGPQKAENAPEEAETAALELRVREDTENKAGDTARSAADEPVQGTAARDPEDTAEKEEEPGVSLEEEEAAGRSEKEKDALPGSAVYDAQEKKDDAGPSGTGRETGSVNTLPEEGEIVIPSGGRR